MPLGLDFRKGRHAPDENVAFVILGKEGAIVGAEGDLLEAFPRQLPGDQLLPGRHVPKVDRFPAFTRRRQPPAVGFPMGVKR